MLNGPVPDVCTTTCDTSSGLPSDAPPSISAKSKIGTAALAPFAVDCSATGSLTPLPAVSIPSELMVMEVMLLLVGRTAISPSVPPDVSSARSANVSPPGAFDV